MVNRSPSEGGDVLAGGDGAGAGAGRVVAAGGVAGAGAGSATGAGGGARYVAGRGGPLFRLPVMSEPGGGVWGAVWPCGGEASSRAAAAEAAVIMGELSRLSP